MLEQVLSRIKHHDKLDEGKEMAHEYAGEKAAQRILESIPDLIASYYTLKPDVSIVSEQVAFGTSGHRGSSVKNSFNKDHILAISQAVCEYRKEAGIEGTLFIGKDTQGYRGDNDNLSLHPPYYLHKKVNYVQTHV